MMRFILPLLLCPALAASDDFDPARTQSLVEALAAPAMEGRLTGTPGEQSSAERIIQTLKELGARPLTGDDYRWDFQFTAGSRDTGTNLAGPDGKVAAGDVRGLGFSATGSMTGSVVFAGYGIRVPESQDFGYDSYVGLDVKDKVVLVLRYYPEEATPEARKILARYSGLRYKALTARELGAKALLVVTGPNSPNAGELAPMSFDTSISGSGIVAASITGTVGERLMAAANRSLAEAQSSLDTANPHVGGFSLGEQPWTLDVQIERTQRTGHNLLARLDAESPESQRPWIILGAHYDHLGRGDGGNSLARQDEVGEVHHGADDNASGVAAVLEAARYLSDQDLGRHVAIAFWSGEELGVIGSSHFVEHGPLDLDQVAAYLNFDMVGRSRDNQLNLQAVGSSEQWPGLIEKGNLVVGFDLSLTQDPYLPTDSTSFYTAGIPTLNFFTGSHEDYHRPSDTADKINHDDLVRVARLGALITRRLAQETEPPGHVKVERTRQEGGGRDSVRAYTGTIPDYTTEVEGLRLSGIMAGGPADQAGLEEGDVIVEFGGQSITNIYDYTYALDAVKIDVPITVVVMRGDQRIEATIVPTSRK